MITWTDDCSVTPAPPFTIAHLVERVLAGEGSAPPFPDLVFNFGLSEEDAELVLDRVGGGVLRASLGPKGAAANVPDAVKDPVAAEAFRRALGAPPPPPMTRRHSAAWKTLVGEITDEQTLVSALQGRRTLNEFLAAELEALAFLQAALDGDSVPAEQPKNRETLRFAAEVCGTLNSNPDANRVAVHLLTAIARWIQAAVTPIMDNHRYLSPQDGSWFEVFEYEAALRLLAEISEQTDRSFWRACLNFRGSIVCSLLAAHPARVGRAMLDSARCELACGDNARAHDLANAVLRDFEAILRETANSGPLSPRDALLFRYLIDAARLLVADPAHAAEALRVLAWCSKRTAPDRNSG